MTRQTESQHLRTLAAIGVLEEQKSGRGKVFVHPAFIRLLASDVALPTYGREFVR